MIFTLIDIFQQNRWINTNADVSREKLLNNNGDAIKSETVLCPQWCINDKIMWQWMFVMFVADKLNAHGSYYKIFHFSTHWGRVTHICVSKLTTIGSDNGLSPGRCQAIIWTSAGILWIGPLGTNFRENWIRIQTLAFKKMPLKMSSAKWRTFCLGLNVLTCFFIVLYQVWCYWDFPTSHDNMAIFIFFIMTSSNGNIIRVTGPLCWEFTGHPWIPHPNASDAELWCFLWSAPEQTVEQTSERLVIWDAIGPIMTSL